MKKYALFFIFVFILMGFNFNTASAQVSTPVSGCVAGDLFSRTTGQACPTVSGGGSVSSTQFLTIGSSGVDVRSVQQILKNEGYFLGTIDGKYGKKTARAVKNFQDDNDLPITGNVDAATRAELSTFGVIATTPTTPSTPQSTTPPTSIIITPNIPQSTTSESRIPNNRVSASILIESADKAGQWYTFKGDGVQDWVWGMDLYLISGKKIKAISIVHSVSGEAWSTSSSQSLLGKILYPLVVTTEGGVQLNSAYDQMYSPSSSTPAYGSFEFPAGSYNLKLYGNTGATPFSGGRIYVEFTDGTSTSSNIYASQYVPVTPPTTARPITILNPNGGTYRSGDSLPVYWNAIGLTTSNNSIGVNIYQTSLGSTRSVFSSNVQNPVSNGQVSTSGNFGWPIPSGTPSGSDYVVYLSNGSNSVQSAPFTITAPAPTPVTPSITVTSPNGGTFSSTGMLGIDFMPSGLVGKQANIFLLNADTNSNYQVSTTTHLSTSRITLNVPMPHLIPAGNRYKLYVEAFDAVTGSGVLATGLSNNYFTITAPTVTSPSPSITVLSPNGGETYKTGDTVNISWRATGVTTGNNSFGIMVYDSSRNTSNAPLSTTVGNPVSGGIVSPNGSFSWTVPQNVAGNFLVYINGLGGYDESNSIFTITNLITPVNNATVSAYLASANNDKVGLWSNFGSGTGNINKNPTDWNWAMNLNLPTPKTISRITVRHNTYGEVWSTGSEGNLYPIVVIRGGTQLNTSYNQNIALGASSIPYLLNLYGQPESASFTGGNLIVEFTDGTSATATIPASSIIQSPIPTIILSPASNNGGSYTIGSSTIRIGWTANNFPTTTGDHVNVYLVPTDGSPRLTLALNYWVFDGRDQVVLPLNPGPASQGGADGVAGKSFNVRVECQTSNLTPNGGNTCFAQSTGLINIVAPVTPLPTATFSYGGYTSANPPVIVGGGSSAQLVWSSTGATSCEAISTPSSLSLPTWTGSKALSGTQLFILPVSAIGPVSVGVRCVNSAGTGVVSQVSFTAASMPAITVSVNGQSVALSPFDTKQQITAGQSMTFSWSSVGATSCAARQGGSFDSQWTGSKALSGTETINIPVEMIGTKAISIGCSNQAGADVKTGYITVIAPPIVASVNLGASAFSALSSYPAGCSSILGYSTFTGKACISR